jgi:hypothetical protein
LAGDELQKLIADLFTLDPSFVEKLKAVLYK